MNANAQTLFRHMSAENRHDLDGTLATLHPDCVFTDHATGQRWHGLDGAAAHYQQHWAWFDALVQHGEGQQGFWSGPDHYVAQAEWSGTHVGEFMGIAPTGMTFRHPFTVFVTFKDGLMASEEFFYDLASLIETLGGEGIRALQSLPYRMEH